MHTMDTLGYGHKKYRPPLSPTSFYQHDYYSRHTTLRPQSEYRFAGGGYPRVGSGGGSRGGGLCSAALVGGALLAAVAVLAVAALAFYMGALRPDNGEPIMTFEGTLRVTRGDVYGGAPGSPAWRERARRYGVSLRQVFAAPSPLRQAFAGAIVTGFGDRRLDVHFRLYLDRRKIPSSVSNIEETLKNVIIQDIQSKHSAFGQIKIDPSSIIIKRDLEHTYHSEQYVKEALNESLATSHPKISSTQNGQDKQSRVGVVRKTTVKPNQDKNKDPDEPEIDTENIPVVQGSFGSFQITKTEADITENKQTKHDDKYNRKHPSITKAPRNTSTTTTTLKPTTKTTAKTTTTRKISVTTSKNRPFTIKSALNIKPKTEAAIKKETERTTSKSQPITKTSTTTSTTTPTSTTFLTTTNNVSQILFDLLTNENHDKDLPKIDTLFTVPHVIDNEPWRPITRPYYETSSKVPIKEEEISEQGPEERIGVAEVVEDISVLESMLTPIPPAKHKEKPVGRPGGLYNVDPNLAADIYIPSPVYTSFTLPTYAPPLKDMETLGSSYPKPHPLPVDKISGVVEDVSESKHSIDDNDGKPIERPPKDKTTSVSINVMQFDRIDNDTEKIFVDGTSIVKRNNTSTSTTSTITPTTIEIISTSTNNYNISETPLNVSTTKRSDEQHIKEHSTKRPNNKVSLIPSTSAPIHTWELVNTSTNNNNDSVNKTVPDKYYNDTLQAIITKNDASFPNTTPKFQSKISILRNLTDIIKKYTQTTSEKPPERRFDIVKEETSKTNLSNIDDDDSMTGSVEVVSDEELEITTPAVITLLPAKSNLGMNRPLRPRPKIEPPRFKESVRGFYSDVHEPNLRDNLNDFKEVIPEASEIITVATNMDEGYEYDGQSYLTSVRDAIKVDDSTQNIHSNNRLPKSNDNFTKFIPTGTDKINTTFVPQGTYRVSYHVTGSVSSKQANKTKILPSYELALDPDVVLEIPVNQTSTLTVDKLKQLASLATISDYNNNSLFRSPGGVISTKAIPSSYTLNQAGFKILTKTYNKIQPSKQDENNFDNSEKSNSKPYYEKPHKEKEKVEKDECNNATSFRCTSGTCLPLTSRCNRLIDCPDGEDERACSCADYLRAEFSQAKICDGVVDCWDYSDEKKCEWCGEGQFVCANAQQCVEMNKVCDGNPDCPLGDDEKSCVALGDEMTEDNEVIPYNEEGFVMVRKRGVWGRLCVESFEDVVNEAHSSLKLPDLGRAVCRAMTFQDAPLVREAREGRKVSSVGYWEVWHNANARAADTRLTFKRATCARHRALRVRCKDLDCGIRPHADAQQPRDVNRHRWGRVVGGGGAAAGAWPWQAALYRDGDFQCGATLISAEWLLSASHCFYQATEAHWVARLGALRRGAWPRGPWERIARVRQVVLHPRYAPRGFRNDIALLRVDPLPLHARLRPACLPPPRAQPPAGQHCTVVGWGQLYEHERVFPDTLQEVELPVISTAECRRRTRLLPLYRVTEDMFCAGYERGGRDACLGDSGGPLMCQESERWFIYGVTSNGYGCARANRPGVYTKVSNYIDWIDSVMDMYTPKKNETTFSSNETESDDDFYADLETAENKRPKVTKTFDTCRGFRCPLGECLPASSVCNGFLECSDGSDEWQCSQLEFNSTRFNPD
ncbi:uncharacterized protein LOC123691065 isoform X1 [Colias croceus]|uniref:uncharacterized protein LOC123691065 isoform X1 n=1 Tax=Colias crocea TaxID=72248 RepID=UPI001E279EB6|nr:uncharacterized protein LOC123691065 isoform X1 [Colias croceus]